MNPPPPLPAIISGLPTFNEPAVLEALQSIESERQQRLRAQAALYANDPGAPRNPHIAFPDAPLTVSEAESESEPIISSITVSPSAASYDVGTVLTFTVNFTGSARTTRILWLLEGLFQKLDLSTTSGALEFEWMAGHLNEVDGSGESTANITAVAANGKGLDYEIASVLITTPPP
jgi:hypothetical protein